MASLIPRRFRVHEAIQFLESLSESAPTRYYFYIAKTSAYANAYPVTGQVKTTTTSNTIVGVGTYFTTELAVGDRLAITGQYESPTTNPRILVVQSIPTAQTIVVSPRPVASNTTGANVYIRKLWSELNPPAPTPSYQAINFDTWRNMISLKKIQSSDASHVVTRVNWANNTFFNAWDDAAVLQTANAAILRYYCLTSDWNVYKCIDNNRNANSTVKPTGTGTSIVSTADGYRWKYMYTIESGERTKFLTIDYMPVKTLTANNGSAQWTVQQNAIISGNGAIHLIKVIANGAGYLSTTNTFSTVTNTTWMKLKSTASGVDGTYVGSGLFISEGAAAGQLRKVVKYWGANNTLIVNSAFSVTPNTTSRYVISPLVTVRGDSGGTTTSRATAYVSNTVGGQVRKITVINQGRSYSTANVVISANLGFGATGRPIISPLNGHGSDPVDELGGTAVMLNVRTTGAESNTFPTNNDFRTIGIIRDPLLANGSQANSSVIDQSTRIGISLASGDFAADEIITGQISGAKARLVYFANTNDARTSGTLKVIRVTTNGTGGGFQVGELVVGSNSTITANVVSVTKPALKPYSGLVIYTENRESVFRGPAQTEDYKFTVKY
jgi:hypothetical protein